MSVIPLSRPQLVINKHLLADIVSRIRIRDCVCSCAHKYTGRHGPRENGTELLL